MAQRGYEKRGVPHAVPLALQIAQIGAMKTGNVFVGIAQLELRQNVVPHVARRTRRKRRDGAIGKFSAEAVQLPVLGTELVSPLGNAVGLVDGKEGDGRKLQPTQSVAALQTFGRQIQQTESAVPRLA